MLCPQRRQKCTSPDFDGDEEPQLLTFVLPHLGLPHQRGVDLPVEDAFRCPRHSECLHDDDIVDTSGNNIEEHLVPAISSAQIVTVLPNLDASHLEFFSEGIDGFAILACVAEERPGCVRRR